MQLSTVVAVTLESGTKSGLFLFVELSFHSSRMSSTERQARCSDDTCQCVSRNHAIEDGQRNMMIKMESLRHLLESLSTTVTTLSRDTASLSTTLSRDIASLSTTVSRDMASLITSMSRIESRLEMDATTTTTEHTAAAAEHTAAAAEVTAVAAEVTVGESPPETEAAAAPPSHTTESSVSFHSEGGTRVG